MNLVDVIGRGRHVEPSGHGSARQRLMGVNPEVFRDGFGRTPFVVRHSLTDHPLFELSRLIELSTRLPPDHVEYNAGNLAVNQNPKQTPQNGLSIEETIRRIEHCRSWMVLKHVEHDSAYRDLLLECLAEVEAQNHPYVRGICKREAFIFISSPGSVTPYHMDPECNFLLQVRGRKQVSLFDGNDRSLLSEQELERFYSGAHRNLVFKDEYQQRASVFELGAGDGLHFPVTWPHWVKVHEEVSVSFSITFQTRATERRDALYYVNHHLRARGWNPTAVGRSPLRDAVKYNTFRAIRRLRNLFGR
jgi:cupin-like protein